MGPLQPVNDKVPVEMLTDQNTAEDMTEVSRLLSLNALLPPRIIPCAIGLFRIQWCIEADAQKDVFRTTKRLG